MPRLTQQEYERLLAREAARHPDPAAARQAAAHQREEQLHDDILAECRRRGWPFVHSRMDLPTTTAPGVPDFIIAAPDGVTLWVEAKVRHRKPTLEQAGWQAQLRRQGHRGAIVRSFGDFLRAAEELP